MRNPFTYRYYTVWTVFCFFLIFTCPYLLMPQRFRENKVPAVALAALTILAVLTWIFGTLFILFEELFD